MAKYLVTMNTVATFIVEVDADSEDAAFAAALELEPALGICCSGNEERGELELGQFLGDKGGITIPGDTAEKVED